MSEIQLDAESTTTIIVFVCVSVCWGSTKKFRLLKMNYILCCFRTLSSVRFSSLSTLSPEAVHPFMALNIICMLMTPQI